MNPRLWPVLALLLFVATPAPAVERAEQGAAEAAHGGAPARDVEARFQRGTQLAAEGRTEEAIDVFLELTEDHPRLPEPFNNLAALYARQGRLEKAKEALERGIRTDESYAAVYENLSTIYVEMARNSYVKALRLDESREAPDLRLLHALHSRAAPRSGAVVASREAAPQAEQASPMPEETAKAPDDSNRMADAGEVAEPAKEAPAKVSTAPEPERVAGAEPGGVPAATEEEEKALREEPATARGAESEPAQGQEVEPAQETDAAPAREQQAERVATAGDAEMAADAQDEPAPPPENREAAFPQAALATLRQWARAWSEQDVEAYLGFYADDFEPEKAASRDAWAETRRSRIRRPEWIEVRLEKLQPERVDDNTVRVRLIQHYDASNYQDKTLKRMVLVRRDGDWRIREETSLEILD